MILLNDWSKEAKRVIASCRILKIPTICIQESIIDFGDSFSRMMHADFAFIQGVQTQKELKRKLYFITGNPRYETIKKVNIEKNIIVAINCNFTYNIYEEIRENWLDDITFALDKNEIAYTISQHPRDNGNLEKYKSVNKSSSSSVHELLNTSKFLITRFSSLIHEALIMGIPIIYYNPHGEQMKYDFDFNEDFLILAKNEAQLNEAIVKLSKGVNFKNVNSYLIKHCILPGSSPSKNISSLINNIDFESKTMRSNDYLAFLIFHPLILKCVFLIKSYIKNKLLGNNKKAVN